MAIYNKLFVFVILLFISQNINCKDVSDDTKEKINEIIGKRQLATRSYLEGLKSNFQGMEYDVRFAVNKARTDLESQLNGYVNKLKIKEANQQCVAKFTQEITQQALTNFDNCILVSKPNLSEAYSAISKYSEFITKVGEVPRSCIQSHTDVDSIIKCVRTSIEEINKQIKAQEKDIEEKINAGKKKISELGSDIKICYNVAMDEFTTRLDDIDTKCA